MKKFTKFNVILMFFVLLLTGSNIHFYQKNVLYENYLSKEMYGHFNFLEERLKYTNELTYTLVKTKSLNADQTLEYIDHLQYVMDALEQAEIMHYELDNRKYKNEKVIPYTRTLLSDIHNFVMINGANGLTLNETQLKDFVLLQTLFKEWHKNTKDILLQLTNIDELEENGITHHYWRETNHQMDKDTLSFFEKSNIGDLDDTSLIYQSHINISTMH